jgi:hypothetical protein
MMEKIEYENYETGTTVSFEYEESDPSLKRLDHFEKREKIGFSKIDICTPYFYTTQSDPPIQVLYFNSKKNEGIVELWDNNERLFGFYCPNLRSSSDALKHLLQIAKSIIYLEKSLGELTRRSEGV